MGDFDLGDYDSKDLDLGDYDSGDSDLDFDLGDFDCYPLYNPRRYLVTFGEMDQAVYGGRGLGRDNAGFMRCEFSDPTFLSKRTLASSSFRLYNVFFRIMGHNELVLCRPYVDQSKLIGVYIKYLCVKLSA